MNSVFPSLSIFSVIALMVSACSAGDENRKNASVTENEKPNIIIFYVDDLGYGDVGCYGSPLVSTPAIDSMAARGLRFTDAHSSSATCTPSRYSLLTGEYAFRSKAAILPGDAPLLIKPGTPTLPAMLQSRGYTTGAVGKWHLGLGNGDVNWNDTVKPGARDIGFDYSFLIPATGDRVPCVFLENGLVVNRDSNDPITVSYDGPLDDIPIGYKHPHLLRFKADLQHSESIINGISRIGYMKGGTKALWKDELIPDVLTARARQFITDNQSRPFFLYFAFHDIHVPRVASDKFAGSSPLGARGDVISQMDDCVGRIVKTLDSLKLSKNTLVIFTSDNGPILDDGYEDQSAELLGNHRPAGPLRGSKYSVYEGGTRMPFVVYCPGKVQQGVSNALINQTDLYASLAALTGYKLKKDEAIDSENLLPALLGQSPEGRKLMLEEAFTLALRKGNMKYIPAGEEPMWISKIKKTEGGIKPYPQLYDLGKSIDESNNIAPDMPQLVQEMDSLLSIIKQRPLRSL